MTKAPYLPRAGIHVVVFVLIGSTGVFCSRSDTHATPERGQAAGTGLGVVIDTTTIWLDSTTIQAAARALGFGDTVLKSVSEGGAVVACFRAAAADTAHLTLTSHDGETGPVVTATIGRDPPRQSYLQSCASLAIPPGRIATTIGLRLGTSRRDAERRLGTPRRVEKNVTWYAMPSSGAAPARGRRDRTVYFALQYRDDVVVRASISRGNEIISELMKGHR